MNNKPRYHSQFGEFIRYRRILLGLSLEALALPCGLDRARLSRIERGDYAPPPLPQLKKMAELLQIPEPSEEFSKMVNIAMEGRLSTPKLKGKKRKGQKVFVHGLPFPSREIPRPEFIRVKENPHHVYDLKGAARKALENVASEGASIVSARLLVRDSKKQEWEYDVMLSQGRIELIWQDAPNKKKISRRRLRK